MSVIPFDIANFNLVNFANAYADLFDSNPKDVKIQVKDNHGRIVTKTIANRGKFQQAIQNYVINAYKRSTISLYIDQKNGNDSNPGTSASKALKSLNKAVKLIPRGAVASIRILGKYVLASDIRFPDGSFITLRFGDGDYMRFKMRYDSKYKKAMISQIGIPYGGSLKIYIDTSDREPSDSEALIKFKIENPEDYADKPLRPTHRGMFYYNSSTVTPYSALTMMTRIRNNKYLPFEVHRGYIYFRRQWDDDRVTFPICILRHSHYKSKLAVLHRDKGARIFEVTPFGAFNFKGSIRDQNGNGVSVKDAVSGIARNSDGSVRNVITPHGL